MPNGLLKKSETSWGTFSCVGATSKNWYTSLVCIKLSYFSLCSYNLWKLMHYYNLWKSIHSHDLWNLLFLFQCKLQKSIYHNLMPQLNALPQPLKLYSLLPTSCYNLWLPLVSFFSYHLSFQPPSFLTFVTTLAFFSLRPPSCHRNLRLPLSSNPFFSNCCHKPCPLLCLFLQSPCSLRTPATYHNLCFYLQPLSSLKVVTTFIFFLWPLPL